MMKAASVPTEQSDVAIQAADALESHAAELLELARLLRDELELAGELPNDFVRRLRLLIESQQASLDRLVAASRGD
jgi:hypothetical protein